MEAALRSTPNHLQQVADEVFLEMIPLSPRVKETNSLACSLWAGELLHGPPMTNQGVSSSMSGSEIQIPNLLRSPAQALPSVPTWSSRATPRLWIPEMGQWHQGRGRSPHPRAPSFMAQGTPLPPFQAQLPRALRHMPLCGAGGPADALAYWTWLKAYLVVHPPPAQNSPKTPLCPEPDT